MNDADLLELLKARNRELLWFWTATKICEQSANKRASEVIASQKLIGEIDVERIKEILREKGNFRDEVANCFRWFVAVAADNGTTLSASHCVAVLVALGEDLDELRHESTMAFVEIESWIETLSLPNNDPWVSVELSDIKVDRSTIRRHIKKFAYVRKGDGTGIYEIQKSHLHEYLEPSNVKKYTV